MRRTSLIIPLVIIVIVGLLSSLFIVDEREKALVLQFGRVVDVKEEPGLAVKIPLIQEVVRYDDRILSRDVDPLEVTPLDDRRLIVDAFARYRITDVRRFREAVGSGGEEAAAQRLDSILRAETREILGEVSSNDILSTDRATLMLRIRNGAISEAQALGLTIIDVRLKRTDLPRENLEATFSRMRAEREREAADEVARGNEAAQRVRAQADRTVVELVSDARRQAEITRGEADARRNAIFAEAFGSDEEFFEFYRSLTAFERSMQQGNSRVVMSPDSDVYGPLFDPIRAGQSGRTGNQTQAPDDAAAADAAGGETPADDADADDTDAEEPTDGAATDEDAAAGATGN